MTRDELMAKLKVELPCTADWSQMKGSDKVRHCAACGNDVYNVARMTEPELRQMFEIEGRICGRIFRRKDGTVVTGDCSWVWQDARKNADQIVSGWSLAGWVSSVTVLVVTFALAVVTIFGDNIRRLFGASAGGMHVPAVAVTTPPSRAMTGFDAPVQDKEVAEESKTEGCIGGGY